MQEGGDVSDRLVLIQSSTKTLTTAAPDAYTTAVDVSQYKDIQIEIEMTSSAQANAADSVQPKVQFAEQGQSTNVYVNQAGYRLYEIDGTSAVIQTGDRNLGGFTSIVCNVNLPYRERNIYTGSPGYIKVFLDGTIVTALEVIVMVVRIYGRRVR